MSLFRHLSPRSFLQVSCKAALLLVGFFFCLGLSLSHLEKGILYHPQTHYLPPGTAKALMTFQEIAVPNVRKIYHYAWYAPASTQKQTLVFFHDSSDTINTTQAFLAPFVLEGYGVLMIEYRGYGEVSGSPEESDIYADTENFFDFLHEVNVKDKQIVIAGQGIGAAVALEMANRHHVAGLVLVSPFINAASYVRHRTGLPILGLFFQENYDNINKIAKIRTPLLILAGQRDKLIPFQDSQNLYQKAQDPKSFVLLPEAAHYNIMGQPFEANVMGWLRAQEALEAPKTPQHQLDLNLSTSKDDEDVIVKPLLTKPQDEKGQPTKTPPASPAQPQQ